MIRIGLYGTNGHQLPVQLPPQVRARITAVADYPAERLDEALGEDTPAREEVQSYDSLQALLADPDVDLISLCSLPRKAQAQDAITCMEAGKHVLAEKPAALTDAELDAVLAAAQRTGMQFHEMAGSFLEMPIVAIRQLVDSGALGTIVHVHTQKSYPWHEGRPQDEARDGGLIRQVGVHAAHFIIGATGQKITSVVAAATGLGNPGLGQIYMAGTFACTLESGAVACMNLNYLHQRNFGSWGNEHIRVFGTRGFAESVDGFRRSRLYLEGQEANDLLLPATPPAGDFLEYYVNHLLDGTPMPVPFDVEMAALRAVISAQEAAETGQRITVKV